MSSVEKANCPVENQNCFEIENRQGIGGKFLNKDEVIQSARFIQPSMDQTNHPPTTFLKAI